VIADFVIGIVVNNLGAVARPRDINGNTFDDPGIGPVGHQQDPIGKQDSFVNVVGDHKDSLLGRGPHPDQLFLNTPAR